MQTSMNVRKVRNVEGSVKCEGYKCILVNHAVSSAPSNLDRKVVANMTFNKELLGLGCFRSILCDFPFLISAPSTKIKQENSQGRRSFRIGAFYCVELAPVLCIFKIKPYIVADHITISHHKR
jgi:hypothetical protein